MNFSKIVSLGVVLLFVGQGCFAPMNMSYDTAKPVGKDQFSITAAYAPSKDQEEHLTGTKNFDSNNFMLRVGYGLSESTSLYGGYYRKNANYEFNGLLEPLGEGKYSYNHADVGLKFSLNKKKTIALKTMFGAYQFDEGHNVLSGQVALLFTKEFSQYAEFSTVLHGTLLYPSLYNIVPGLNINAGFSKDRSKWVIRPEIGISSLSVTAGVGLEVKLNRKAL